MFDINDNLAPVSINKQVDVINPRYKLYSLHNFEQVPQVKQYLTEEQIFNIKVVGHVFAFKVNPYVIDQLIDWDSVPEDPIFILTFPQKEMLLPHHFEMMAEQLKLEASDDKIEETANKIRLELNPHPAGQMSNVPVLKDGTKLPGIQHKYKETALFFALQGQTCHAHCTFCFRWPQFVGMKGMRFSMKEVDLLVRYLQEHPEVTDVLFTGGDPMIMPARIFGSYIKALLDAELPNLKTIRIGSKSLTYWPHKYTTDKEAPEILGIFKTIIDKGLHVAFMAHFNHPRELSTEVVKQAIANIRAVGVEIRAQSPILRHINDNPAVWHQLWEEEVRLGIIPYYMFQVRDTGAKHYFNLPLAESYHIFKEAASMVSGLSRTVRGPSMSAMPGKIEVLGIQEIHGEKVFVLRMLQGRNHEWCYRPFFAKYDPNAVWIDDLEPVFAEKFFFE